MYRKLSLLALPLILVACASTPQPSTAPAAEKAAVASAGTAGETEAQRVDRIISTLASHSIYFDYNDFTIKPEYMTQLKQDFELMRTAPKVVFMLEGNADDRGSAEYNLALGQKRADAVKRALRALGIPESQLESVSFGKEKPRATCNEEKCWAENRRVDFSRKMP